MAELEKSITATVDDESASAKVDDSSEVSASAEAVSLSAEASDDKALTAEASGADAVTASVSDIVLIDTGGTSDHSALYNLSYDRSGHTGFQKAITEANKLDYSLIENAPTDISVFNNDSGYVTRLYHDSTKYDATNPSGFVTADYHDATKADATDLNGYLPLSGGTLTGKLSGTAAEFSGRAYGSGDDEGIVIGKASDGYATLTLGEPSGERSVFGLDNEGKALWKKSDGTDDGTFVAYHPGKSGTIALTSDIPDISGKQEKLTAGKNITIEKDEKTGELTISADDQSVSIVDNLDSEEKDSALSANQGRVLNAKFASYLPLDGTGKMTGVLKGTSAEFSEATHVSGDDEGIVIGKANDGYALVTLGDPSGARSVFALDKEGSAFWKISDGTDSGTFVAKHPGKTGTLAVTSDIPDPDLKQDKLTAGTGISIAKNEKEELEISSTVTDTWRGIQNKLSSDSETDSLSAKQGKVLNESKLDVASIDVSGKETTILALVQELGKAKTGYARWYTVNDSGSSKISDKPTGDDDGSFVCEAYLNKSTADGYRYILICWVQSQRNPFVSVADENTTGLSWSSLLSSDSSLYVKLGSTAQQTIKSSDDSRTPLFVQSGETNKTGSMIGYKDKDGTALGYIGVSSGKSPIFVGSGDQKTLAYDDVVSKTADGLCPKLPNETTTSKFLRQDGAWSEPPDTKYESKDAAEDGADVSLVTTGEKYAWDNKISFVSWDADTGTLKIV